MRERGRGNSVWHRNHDYDESYYTVRLPPEAADDDDDDSTETEESVIPMPMMSMSMSNNVRKKREKWAIIYCASIYGRTVRNTSPIVNRSWHSTNLNNNGTDDNNIMPPTVIHYLQLPLRSHPTMKMIRQQRHLKQQQSTMSESSEYSFLLPPARESLPVFKLAISTR